MLFDNEKVDKDVFLKKLKDWCRTENIGVANNPNKLYEAYIASETIGVFDFLYDLCADDMLILD